MEKKKERRIYMH